MTKAQTAERDEAIQKLREWIKPGDTVYTICDSLSRSGMSRQIRVVLMKPSGKDGNGQPVDLHPNWLVGKALGLRHGKTRSGSPADGLIVGGCGMDMGFHVVYNLGRVLFPDGFPVVERCDKCQDRPGLDGLGRPCKTCKGTGQKPARGRNGDMSGWDKDGGYALKQRWL